MLKKKISMSRKLSNLKSDSARLLYTWLIPHLDIEGRFSADSKVVKGSIFPRLKHSYKRIAELLKDLKENKLITIYENGGDSFLQLIRFKEEQNLRENRESPSKIPPPPAELLEQSRTTKGELRVKLSKVKLSKVNMYAHKNGRELTEEEIEKRWQRWWKGYPRKEDEGKAREKYMFLVCRRKVDPDYLDDALIGYLKCEKSKGTDHFFLKYAKTFLYPGNPEKGTPGTWEQYLIYADTKYKIEPKL